MKKPTAVARTISIFTGRTDLEDPSRGRDGSYGEPTPTAAVKPPEKFRPLGGLSVATWERPGQIIRYVAADGTYVLLHHGKQAGVFASIVEAGIAADKLRGKR